MSEAQAADPATESTGENGTETEEEIKKYSVGTEHLVSFCAAFDMTHKALSEAMGKSGNFVSGCIRAGKAPSWTLLATECLNRRMDDGAVQPSTYRAVVTFPGGDAVCDALILGLDRAGANVSEFE
jgi:hypothetical protein